VFVVSLGLGGLAWAGEAEDAFKEGARLLSAAKLREAVPYFDKAIELNPKNARAYGDRGIAWFLLWKHADAQLDFAKCYELEAA
jgi:tetratricopeptide (TPR) repeat protein